MTKTPLEGSAPHTHFMHPPSMRSEFMQGDPMTANAPDDAEGHRAAGPHIMTGGVALGGGP